LILYGTTIGINLLLFTVVFPITANLNSGTGFKAASTVTIGAAEQLFPTGPNALITLRVEIPCSGHAPLITGELKKISGVENIKFRLPNLFDIGYDSQKTTKEEILSLEVFNTYKATLIGEKNE